MITAEKQFMYKGKTWILYKFPDGIWRDAFGIEYGIRDDSTSLDLNDVCGAGWFSLPENHPANDICRVHDQMYSIPLYQRDHTRLEADKWLRDELKAKGYWFAKPFFWVSRTLGRIFWEGKK